MSHKNVVRIMLVLPLLLCLPALCPVISGDGGFFIPTVDRWMSAPEEKQMGVIEYKNGIQDLTIAIDVKNSSLQADEAFWIFPVPAAPEKITIDIEKNISFLRGEDVAETAKESMSFSSMVTLCISQPYLSPFLFVYVYAGGMMISGSIGDLTVYQHMEKMGLTTELVGTNDSAAFSSYLNQHDVRLTNDTLAILNEYIGKDYSFVVSWISNVSEFRKNALIINNEYYSYHYYYGEPFFMLGITIHFPTDRIYYPLKLTSIYGEKEIPIYLQIHGYVTPFSLQDNMEVHYAIDGNIRYTEITIRSKAEDLTQDLWIENTAPPTAIISSFITENIILATCIIFIFCSCLASVLAGIIIFQKQQPSLIKFALLGLCNFMSVIGFFIASFKLKIDQTFVKLPIEKKIVEKKKTNALSPITWVGIGIGVLFLILVLFVSGGSFYPLMMLGEMLLIFLFIGPIIGIIALFVYGRRKDKQNNAFVILFSIFFIVLMIVIQIVLQTIL